MREASFRSPLAFAGRYLRLVPLVEGHAAALADAGRDPDVRRYLLTPPGTSFDDMAGLIAVLLDFQRRGDELPFAIVRASDGAPVGMTRYLRIDRPNDSVDIGGTWFDRRYWRTPFNTESKYLLLRHAFETEGAYRVALQTDRRNLRSQAAIERLGAVREAELREDRLLPDGTFRTSVHYSILTEEWPNVKRFLESQLARGWGGSAPGGA